MDGTTISHGMSAIEMAVTVFVYVFAAGFLGVFLVLLWKMATDRIDLEFLISEVEPPVQNAVAVPGIVPMPPLIKASLSRFQLLLFTLVVAGLYLILCLENGQLIDIPNGTLGLLGISAGGFVVSKSITNKKK